MRGGGGGGEGFTINYSVVLAWLHPLTVGLNSSSSVAELLTPCFERKDPAVNERRFTSFFSLPKVCPRRG